MFYSSFYFSATLTYNTISGYRQITVKRNF